MFDNEETKEDKWDGDPPEETDLEVRLQFKVRTNKEYGGKTLAKVNVTKSLQSTTDTELENLRKELENKVEKEFNDLFGLLENDERLTEGYHKQERQKKKEESE